MLNRTRALVSAAVLAVAAGLASPGWAQDTLRDAAELAYRTNPTVLQQRANQRALDESVPACGRRWICRPAPTGRAPTRRWA